MWLRGERKVTVKAGEVFARHWWQSHCEKAFLKGESTKPRRKVKNEGDGWITVLNKGSGQDLFVRGKFRYEKWGRKGGKFSASFPEQGIESTNAVTESSGQPTRGSPLKSTRIQAGDPWQGHWLLWKEEENTCVRLNDWSNSREEKLLCGGLTVRTLEGKGGEIAGLTELRHDISI